MALTIDPEQCGLRGARILCAVSGGADSVALLRLLCDVRDRGECELYAAHFEHGIRGEASLEDMRFVVSLCGELNVPLRVGRADVPAEAVRAGEGLETCARRLRHEFLEKTRRELGADVIALAHHRRDRAETVLMHLLRGAGRKGAAALPARDGVLARPLIDLDPEELRAFLTGIGQPWREDESNFTADNPRNALRLNVFPELRKIYPGFETALCRFADITGEEDRLLDRLTREYLESGVRCEYGVFVLALAEKAILRRAIRSLFPQADLGFTESALNAKDYRDAGAGVRVCGSEDGRLYLIPPLAEPEEQMLALCGTTVLEGVCTAECAPCAAEPVRDNGRVQALDAGALRGAALRLRRNGDFIRPLGMDGRRKSLGDYLTDRKFPLPLRDRLPVIADGNEILWAPGVGISEKAKLSDGSEAVMIRIKTVDGGIHHA